MDSPAGGRKPHTVEHNTAVQKIQSTKKYIKHTQQHSSNLDHHLQVRCKVVRPVSLKIKGYRPVIELPVKPYTKSLY